MEQADHDRMTAQRYEAARASRNDPVDSEMQTLQTTYKELSQLTPAARERVMTYLKAVLMEKLS